MKKVKFLVYLIFTVSVFSQQFHSLDYYNDAFGDTQLIYRFGEDYYFYNPIYKLNLRSNTEILIMDAFRSNYPGGEIAKAVLDYKFFPNDSNFINCGFTIYPDNHGYIARNDTIVFGGMSDFNLVDISHQTHNKTFASNLYQTYRSFDGGFTYPLDSLINFPLVSVADFDDKTFFGLNSEKKLIKSIDNGNSYSIVDGSEIYFDRYFDFKYDQNQFHIYRVNRFLGGYAFSVSNNKGNYSTWSKTYESQNPIFITNNPFNSGVVYLADGRTIYRSTNNGYTFTPYINLENKIVGICEPAANILFAATKSKIYKITSDSISVVKSLPIPEDVFTWFPLKSGNKWIYASYWMEYNPSGTPISHFVGTKIMKVVKDTLINNIPYFLLENDLLHQFVFEERILLRVDSATGFVYRYWPDLNSEYLFHNLNAEVGDIIYNPHNPSEPYYKLISQDAVQFWGQNTHLRIYSEYCIGGCSHHLVKGFGLGYSSFDEFGGVEDRLKGCILDGVVYGDTTFIVGVDEKNELITIEFKLSQNYPNPFNPSTRIQYQVSSSSHVTLKVYDVLGNEVATLVDEYKEAGSYEVEFSASSGIRYLASGIYFYQLKAGDFVQTKKMILIR